MIVDYIESGSDECPLIRLRNGDTNDYAVIVKALELLITYKIDAVDLFAIDGLIKGDNMNSFIFIFGDSNKGIFKTSLADFICRYSADEYKEVIKKLSLYSNKGYYWLDDFINDNNIQLLLSYTGNW